MFLKDLYAKYKERKQRKELYNSVKYLLACDDDILEKSRKDSLMELKKALQEKTLPLSQCEERFARLSPAQDFRRKMRNFLDVLVVACTVAGGIRALYIQPFRIPTSSMQPTLFGIHYVDREKAAPFQHPFTRFMQSLTGSRAYVKVRQDGLLSTDYRMRTERLFWTKSDFQIGNELYTVPGDFMAQVLRYLPGAKAYYQESDIFCDGYLSTGDHVFVERLSIHFRDFKRGDVIVFNTEGLSSPTQPIGGYYYIKRLIGLPGDTLQISDNVVMIRPKGAKEFRPAWEFSDSFKKIYSLKGGYQGHRADGLLSLGGELTVPEGHYFALGDNTNFSLDGRNWGFIPRKNMIGLAVMIFWPVSRRWGIVDRKGPLDTPTVMHKEPFFQPGAMCLQ